MYAANRRLCRPWDCFGVRDNSTLIVPLQYSSTKACAPPPTAGRKSQKNDSCKDRRYPCLHMENSPLLRIENLVTAFPVKGNRTLTAVDGVDLSIPTDRKSTRLNSSHLGI